MRRLLLTLMVVAMAVGCTQAAPEGSWFMPPPEDGAQYRITEMCDLIVDEGYDISGSIGYTVTADELGILDDLPVLVRAPAEAAIGDGIQLNLQLNGLCRYVS